jgi:glycosyltransferase involved in cell wall biosynthesis
MKLIIQIPCYNEEGTLPATLGALPKQIDGFTSVECLIIDDGSTDDTYRIATEHGAKHIVRLNKNTGLANAFSYGLQTSLRLGADVIVNTDADNQYHANDIDTLIHPILEGKADMVIGERPISEISHFSPGKRLLQKLGSWVVRQVSGTTIIDVPSGFRAFSREAALKLNIFSTYTYTLETIIQAGMKNISICSVPIRINEKTRNSRLIRSTSGYVFHSISTIVRIFVLYRPFAFFSFIGISFISIGLVIGLRFLYFFFSEGGYVGHIQSLILSAVLVTIGFQAVLAGFIADVGAGNRKLLEELLFRLRQRDLNDTK